MGVVAGVVYYGLYALIHSNVIFIILASFFIYLPPGIIPSSSSPGLLTNRYTIKYTPAARITEIPRQITLE